ncbi:MAG TPA: S8 family serine peptidase [Thermoanaerobaculia bacterium]|nr:S8 family serine peptidase [Thermoanaerobaculia bacterium]
MQRFRGPRGEVLALLLAFALGCAGVRTPPATTASAAADQGSGLATSHQVMVTLKPAPPTIWTKTTYEIAQDYQLRTVFAWTMVSLNEQCIVFEIPRNRSQEEILRRLRADPRVGTAQPIATFDALSGESSYNDPYAHLQRSIQALDLDKAHRLATGKGVRIAVIDTGVDVSHPDLRGRIARVGNFVEHGEQEFTNDIHGTAVVGVIAAETNNQVGIVGVAPQAEIYALKACWPKAPGTREAVCDSYTLARAIDFAIAQGVQILNFSLGGPHDPLLARLIGTALQRGIVVVAADPGDSQRSFPASLPGVIAVLGVDQAVPGAPQPRAGPPDVGAPSVDILSTVPHGSYDFFSGSSLAAAQVSGVVALLLEREPHLAPAQVGDLLRQTSRKHSPSQVDACAALAAVVGQGDCD